MFNKQDQRCTAVQLMLSTDPSYDNRTIASTLKMQIRTVQRLRVMKTKFLAMVIVFGVVSSQGHIMPPHIFEVSLMQSGDRWQTLGVAAGLSTGSQVQRDPVLASEGVLRLCTLLSLAPFSPRPKPTGLLCLVIHRKHHQHDLPQHQSQPDCSHPLSSLQCLWKRHGSSRSISRRYLRLKAATLNRCQLYYIIKLPEFIFSIKGFLLVASE